MAQTFRLYEALLWEPEHGYFLLERHLDRLARSAAHFGFPVDPDEVRARLGELAEELPDQPRKLRLEVSADGGVFAEHGPATPARPVRVALADSPVDSRDPLLRHKTSRREVYERALAGHPKADDVLLWNERRELTETCTANLVVELDGCWRTPAVACGLLPGTFRAELLERGEIEEAIVPVEALADADSIRGINSVRRWFELRLQPAG